MKRGFYLLLCLFASVAVMAQNQQGVVKTRGRMVNGMLQPGQGLQGATVQVRDRSAVVSGAQGKFSFPVLNNTYLLQSVKKQGYQLVDMEVCRNYKYSADPIYLVMETPEQQRSDQLAAERKIRRNLQRQLQQREDEIEALKVSQQEKDSLLRILYQQQTDNEKLIADMAKRYSTLDYDQLDGFYRQVSWYIENGELTRADSLLRTRGDINAQVQNILQHGEAIHQQEAQLQQAKSVHQADIDEAARRCYSYYETFFAQHQNDSAAYYLELRAALDTTNVEWLNEAGIFIVDYLVNYNKASDYFKKCLETLNYQTDINYIDIVMTLNNLGSTMLRQGQYKLALETLSKALNLFSEKVNGKDFKNENDSIKGASVGVALSLYKNIGNACENLGFYDEAIEYFTQALAVEKHLFGADYISLADTYLSLGYIYNLQDKTELALDNYKKAAAIIDKNNEKKYLGTSTIYNNIGVFFMNQGDYTNAMQYLQRAILIDEELFGKEHPKIAMTIINLGTICCNQKQYLQGLDYYKKALSILNKVYGGNHPDIAKCCDKIGSTYFYMGDYPSALEYHYKALELGNKFWDKYHIEMAPIYNSIGIDLGKQEKYSESLEYLTMALAIKEAYLGTEHADVASSYEIIGVVYDNQEDYPKALEYYNKALQIRLKLFGTEHSGVAELYYFIGKVYAEQKDYDKALQYYKKALSILEEIYGLENLNVAKTCHKIGFLYSEIGNSSEALKYLKSELGILEKLLGSEHADLEPSYYNVAFIYSIQNNYVEAIRYYKKALTICESSDPDSSHKNKILIDIYNLQYKNALFTNSMISFLSEYAFTITIIEGDSPAKQQGMNGEYILFEFNNWTQDSTISLYDKNEELRGKPKDIVVMKDGVISHHHFENTIGAQFGIKQVGKEEKQRINQAYEKWKEQNK